MFLVAAWVVHAWTAGRYRDEYMRLAKQAQEHALEQHKVIVALEESESGLMGHLTKTIEESGVLGEELQRARLALGDAEAIVTDLTKWRAPVREVDPKVVTKWLPAPPCAIEGEPAVTEQPIPMMYAEGTNARLKTEAGARFIVGEVRVWGVAEPEDVLLYEAPWEFDATEWLTVKTDQQPSFRRLGFGGQVSRREPESQRTDDGYYGDVSTTSKNEWTLTALGSYRIGRVTWLAGVNSDPGVSVGALWNGRAE
jgi:hypothetical protein